MTVQPLFLSSTHGNKVSRRFGNMSEDPASRWRDQDLTPDGRPLCPEPPPYNASFFDLFWSSRSSESPKMLLLEGRGEEGHPGAGTTTSDMPCSSFAGVGIRSICSLKSFGGLGPTPGTAERGRNSLWFTFSKNHRLVWGADEETDNVSTTRHQNRLLPNTTELASPREAQSRGRGHCRPCSPAAYNLSVPKQPGSWAACTWAQMQG